MIEKIILDYLSDALDVEVYMQQPDVKPARYVLIEKTGSRRQDWINHATIALQSYAESMHVAALLNEEVKTAVDGIVALDKIGNARLNSDYNFTDTERKTYRYQAVYDITHY